jgi:hypothetical protein
MQTKKGEEGKVGGVKNIGKNGGTGDMLKKGGGEEG